MFIGHIAAGVLAKQLSPRESLATTILAAQWADVLWPVLVLTGVERMAIEPHITDVYPLRLDYMPWSHGLVMSVVWSGAAFLLFRRLGRTNREASVIAGAVFSHWVLDVASHIPDMPLGFDETTTRVGLGLWRSLPATLAVELSLFGFAFWRYAHTTSATRRSGDWLLAALVIFLLGLYLVSLFVMPLQPDTPDLVVVGPGIMMWGIALWSRAIDRARQPVSAPNTVSPFGVRS